MYQLALKHFQSVDPVLHQVALKVGELPLLSPRHPRAFFAALCNDIIGQQLSGKVADVFWARFLKLFPSSRPTPSQVLTLRHSTLRGIGISHSKADFLHHLARAVISHTPDLSDLPTLPDIQVVAALTAIKGIGPWTAEMFLIFTLGRPDVFSVGDQGLKNAIKKLYVTPPDPSLWSPYRSFACRILWKYLDS